MSKINNLTANLGITPKEWKKLFIEALLIIFSVLFALFINKAADNYKLQQQKKVAIERITIELDQNIKVLERLHQHHSVYRDSLQKILRKPVDTTAIQAIFKDGYFNFSALNNNKTFINEFPSTAAWNAAKSTNIIAEFEYEEVTILTEVYDLQKIIGDRTIPKILDLIFDRTASKAGEERAVLQQMYLLNSELVGQEFYLKRLLERALRKMEE